MINTIMNKFKSMVDSWVVVRFTQALINHELLIVSSDLFILIILHFYLVAELKNLDFVNAAVN